MSRSKMGELLGAACISAAVAFAVAYRESGWPVVVIIMAIGILLAALVWRQAHLAARKEGVALRIELDGSIVSCANQETLLVVAGKIANPRNVQASVVRWNISAKLPDGQTIESEIFVPPQFPFRIPFRTSTEIVDFTKDGYWPTKLETTPIPPHGVSSGFVFGLVRGVASLSPVKPGTSIILRCEDTDGMASSGIATMKAPPTPTEAQSSQSPELGP